MVMVLFVAGIMVYQSFALYEEKQEFDVIKGNIPDQNYDLKLSYIITDKDGNKTNSSVVPEKSNDQKYEVEVNCDHTEGS